MYVTVTKVIFLINALHKSVICEGNSDEDYLKLLNIHENVLMNLSVRFCNITLRREDFWTLKNLEWLNDQVGNILHDVYMSYIIKFCFLIKGYQLLHETSSKGTSVMFSHLVLFSI